MSYLDLPISKIHELLVNDKITYQDLIKEALEKAHKYQPTLNLFETIIDNPSFNGLDKSNPLFGIPYVLKDNFSTKGILTTGSSNILKDYVPVYDATVVEKLRNSGAILVGKTALDELALGGTGTNGHNGPVHNPYNLDRQSGGSSGGSVVAVSSGIVPFAIGSDTGDSTRKPAAFNGVVGFKPTWGLISRYGLFPFATSLDHVGIFTRNVLDCAYVFENLAGYDSKDMSSANTIKTQYSKNLDNSLKGKKIGIIKEINDSMSNSLVKDNMSGVISLIKNQGCEVKEFNVDERLLRAILPVYLVISCSEATSNDACLDGIRYGIREEGETYIKSIINTRTKGFSELVKRRFVIGSYCLKAENQEKLFIRAQKVRRLIVDTFNKIFEECDCVIFPASGDVAPLIKGASDDEKLSSKYLIGENHLAIANFGGFPSITIPSGFINEMPIGINITGKCFDDQKVLDIASGIENTLGLKDLVKEVK